MSAEAADRDSEMLRELAELGLAMARDLAARSAAAEDDAVANNLARSFERVSRSVRHCLALIVRLKDGTVLNAPQIGNATGWHDKVVSVDLASRRVTLALSAGFARDS